MSALPATGGRAPSFPGTPLLGHLGAVNRDILGLFTAANDACGQIARLRLGHKTAHAVFSADMAEQVLIEQRDKFVKYSTITTKVGLPIVLGKGLLMSTGELWARQRKLMNPFFHKQSVAKLADTITASGSAMIERWNHRASIDLDRPVNFQEEMLRTTLEIIGQSMFSVSDLSATMNIIDSINVAAHTAFATVKNPLHPPLSWPTPGNRRFHAAMARLNGAVYELIDARMDRNPDDMPKDLLGAMIAARYDDGSRMSREQLRDEVVTIMGAGHETTAMALTWGCQALARHPEALRRMQAEIDSVLGTRSPTLADLPNLPVVANTFSETLRLYPTAPIIPRAVLTDAQLAGYDIPAGTMIYTSLYHIHRDPKWWSDPLAFKPERFEKGKPAHRCSYVPFGAGPRFCIGNNLAELEAQLLTAQIYQHYDVELVDNCEPFGEVAVTMRPRGGLPVRLKRRR